MDHPPRHFLLSSSFWSSWLLAWGEGKLAYAVSPGKVWVSSIYSSIIVVSRLTSTFKTLGETG